MATVEDLLTRIRHLRTVQRETEQSNADFVSVQDMEAWCTFFQDHIQFAKEGDDLLFYVKQMNNDLLIHRKHSTSRLPPEIGSPTINWEETVCLNFLLQRFHYRLTMVVSSRDESSKALKTISRCDQDIYCSPSRRNMDSKGSQDVITYPDLFFTLDNFEDLFHSIVVPPNSSLRIELVAAAGKIFVPIFSGQVGHSALSASYARQTTTVSTQTKREFLQLTGPNNVGSAQVAVAQVGAGKPASRGLVQSISQGAVRVLQSMVAYGPASASPTNLNACITYISLPWSSLLAAILHTTRKPALSRSPSSSALSSSPTARVSMTIPPPAAAAAAAATSVPSAVPEDPSPNAPATAS
eukprot:m.40867 g.40867  ORF g.40867 m.40867 type:complete len:354 (-) comp5637_c0_seq1:587-1648(-)